MRYDKKKGIVTLEEDIVDIWKQHGLEVTNEEVKKDTWIITAKTIKGWKD